MLPLLIGFSLGLKRSNDVTSIPLDDKLFSRLVLLNTIFKSKANNTTLTVRDKGDTQRYSINNANLIKCADEITKDMKPSDLSPLFTNMEFIMYLVHRERWDILKYIEKSVNFSIESRLKAIHAPVDILNFYSNKTITLVEI